jgi:WD40 repeat protein
MLNRTLLLLIITLLFTSCVTKPIDAPATPAVRLEATVSALETRLADLQTELEQTTALVSMATPLPSTMSPSEPTIVSPRQTGTQIPPYVGPVKISAMAYDPGGDALYLARTIDVQRNQDGIEQTLYTWPEAISDLLTDFSADGSALAARLNNGDVVVIGFPQSELMRTLKLGVDFEERPISLALSPDGSQVAVAAGENTIQIWDVKSGRLSTNLTQPGSGVTYQDLTFSPDGATLLGGFLNTITRWDIATGDATTIEPGCRGDTIFDLTYSPDGKQLAIACGPLQSPVGFLIIWDVISNRPVFLKEEILKMQHVAFSPDGAWLATGGPDGAVMLWETTGNKEPISNQSQSTPIDDVIFSPDGSELVYAIDGGLVYLSLVDITSP